MCFVTKSTMTAEARGLAALLEFLGSAGLAPKTSDSKRWAVLTGSPTGSASLSELRALSRCDLIMSVAGEETSLFESEDATTSKVIAIEVLAPGLCPGALHGKR